MLYRAAQTAQQLADDGLADLGMAPRHVGVLTLLEGGPQSQQELEEGLRIDRTTMVALIDELERRGHAEHHRDPADRRRYAIRLAPAGVEAQARAASILAACETAFMAPLSREERDPLVRLLARLDDARDAPEG